jgi:hypothetical protein
MIPNKPAPDAIRGGPRFSEKDHAPTTSWSGMTIRRKVIPLQSNISRKGTIEPAPSRGFDAIFAL